MGLFKIVCKSYAGCWRIIQCLTFERVIVCEAHPAHQILGLLQAIPFNKSRRIFQGFSVHLILEARQSDFRCSNNLVWTREKFSASSPTTSLSRPWRNPHLYGGRTSLRKCSFFETDSFVPLAALTAVIAVVNHDIYQAVAGWSSIPLHPSYAMHIALFKMGSERSNHR